MPVPAEPKLATMQRVIAHALPALLHATYEREDPSRWDWFKKHDPDFVPPVHEFTSVRLGDFAVSHRRRLDEPDFELLSVSLPGVRKRFFDVMLDLAREEWCPQNISRSFGGGEWIERFLGTAHAHPVEPIPPNTIRTQRGLRGALKADNR